MQLRADAPSPRVWALLGYKAGDNTQVRSLATALDWPWEPRRLRYRPTELLSNLCLGPTVAGIDPQGSDALGPPWPDVVISSGRRNEPVARWIRAQSGDRAKLVQVGRPWADPSRFDLVLTTPQYQVPPADNVVTLQLPLHGVTSEKLAQAAQQWAEPLSSLPAPRIVVLVGGNSGSFLVTVDRVRQLRLAAEQIAQSSGGSLLISDSARTPPAAREALFAGLEVPHHLYRWGSSAGENPYLGYLALGDRFIVTGDSVSMVAEACATGKPVYLVHPQRHPFPLSAGSEPGPDWRRAGWYGWRPLSHRLAQHLGPRRMRRDVSAFLQALVDSGRAAWLGGPEPGKPVAGSPDLALAVARVRALF
ncbi:MAG: mitochondrial fission ELM1 family protein [Chromatiales bacterium]|nr:MAG: mitochondrial fission ELM1 family protein [Chromatiales bacterium]